MSARRRRRTGLSTKESGPIYFYGHTKRYGEYSNFYRVRIVDAKGRQFTSSEQAFMFRKARIMGDKIREHLILTCRTPGEAKRLGRKVGSYHEPIEVDDRIISVYGEWDQDRWDEESDDVMFHVNLMKFEQDADLAIGLMATEGRILAEASPRDRIWGIGLSATAAQAGEVWRGANGLGNVLMDVRDVLLETRAS